MFETLIRGGRVVDGTGAPWFLADIGIRDGMIAAVGRLRDAEARQVIDATGLTVAPGFIDIHDHSDVTLLVEPSAASAVHQGVTTIVPGNCGYSPAPLADPADGPQIIFGYGPEITIDWQTFGEYLDRLERQGIAVNVAMLVGHGAIRTAAMGFAARPASAEEIGRMQELLVQALDAGAFGLSLGLEYAPGQNASQAELLALARIVADAGRIVAAHIRSRDFQYIPAVKEVLAIAEATGVSTQISHLTARFGAAHSADEEVRALIEQTRERGFDITCDMHPNEYSYASPTSALPPWVMEGGPAQVLRRLADPAIRARIKEYRYPQCKLFVAGQWDKVFIWEAPHSPEVVGRPLDEVAAERGVDPYDVLLDVMLAEGEHFSAVRYLALGYVDQAVLRAALAHPLFMFESDSSVARADGPLAARRNPYAFGWVPRFLGVYAREKRWFSLEEAIRKLTSMPARKLGLTDRGLIRPGMRADLVVFDARTIRPNDTPAEPNRYPTGIEYVFVNGRLTVEHGVHTGVRAGQVLRA